MDPAAAVLLALLTYALGLAVGAGCRPARPAPVEAPVEAPVPAGTALPPEPSRN